MPIYIFHGSHDGVVFYESSVRLKRILKSSDKLITLDGHGHDPNRWDSVYIKEIQTILNNKETNAQQ